eukprot:11228090-Lingulodinium_polyedra.AAC.1
MTPEAENAIRAATDIRKCLQISHAMMTPVRRAGPKQRRYRRLGVGVDSEAFMEVVTLTGRAVDEKESS